MWLTPTVTIKEKRALSHNLSSLISQIKSVLALLSIYLSYYPAFSNIFLLLSSTDIEFIVLKLVHYSNTLWAYLKMPSSSEFRYNSTQMLFYIDSLLTSYLLHTRSPCISSLSSKFEKPARPAKPSVINQITFTEVTVDPYIRSLQLNYYYPLSPLDMMSPPSSSHLDSMGIDEDLEDAPTDSSTTSKRSKLLEKRKVTVEDSMEVISELISEIQSSEMLPSIQTVSSQDYP